MARGAPCQGPQGGSNRSRQRGRGHGRGRGGRSLSALQHSQWSRYAGREHGGSDEMKRIVSTFCSCLNGAMRLEGIRALSGRSDCDSVDVDFLDNHWLVLEMIPLSDSDAPREAGQPDPLWRQMRDKLEALTVLSAVACTESYAWRRNVNFWKGFIEDRDRKASRGAGFKPSRFGFNAAAAVPAPRNDSLMPRFLLDCSFATISAEMIMLVCRVLLGSEKTMRASFINAMAALATVPNWKQSPRTIPIALRFTRCKFEGGGGVAKLVHMVLEVNRCRRTRHRELSKTTSKTFYYQVVELDLSGVELSIVDRSELCRLAQNEENAYSHLRLVLDKTVHLSTDTFVPFGTLAMSWFQPEKPIVHQEEPEPESPMPHLNGKNSSSAPGAVAEVSLNMTSLSSQGFVSLISAIDVSGCSGARNLSLCNAFHSCETKLVWAWLTHSLWGRESTGQLMALDISSNPLKHSDIAAIKKIATTAPVDRLKLLYGMFVDLDKPSKRQAICKNKLRDRMKPAERDSNETSVWVSVPAGTPLSLSTRTKSDFVLAENVIVRVVEAAVDRTVVLVPAYGFVSVASAAVTKVSVDDSTHKVCRLKELRMNRMIIDEDEDADAIVGSLFSHLVIPFLVKLELSGNALGSATLHAVLAACPQLKILGVESCELQSIGELLSAYSRGSCRVESLNLAENHISNRDIVELCRLMVDPASPASRIHTLDLSYNPTGQQSLRALRIMARNNWTLSRLVLDRAQDVDSTFRASFYQFHDQPLGFQALPEAHKHELTTALLALSSNETLDSSVVDRICEFAGSDVRRRVIWK